MFTFKEKILIREIVQGFQKDIESLPEESKAKKKYPLIEKDLKSILEKLPKIL